MLKFHLIHNGGVCTLNTEQILIRTQIFCEFKANTLSMLDEFQPARFPIRMRFKFLSFCYGMRFKVSCMEIKLVGWLFGKTNNIIN